MKAAMKTAFCIRLRSGDEVFFSESGERLDAVFLEIGGKAGNVVTAKDGADYLVLNWCRRAAEIWKGMQAL